MESFKVTKVLSVPKTSVDILKSSQLRCCKFVDIDSCAELDNCNECLFDDRNEKQFRDYKDSKIKA